MPDGSPKQLDYAEALPFRRRRVVRRATLAFLVIAVAVFVSVWGPRTWKQYRLLSTQRECLDYTAPPDQVIFDTRASSLPQLSRSDPEVSSGLIGPLAYVGRIPAAWSRYRTLSDAGGTRSLATAFLHRLKSPRGNERLVVVDLFDTPPFTGPDRHAVLVPCVFLPATRHSPATELRSAGDFPVRFILEKDSAVFAGQVDPLDPAHFTIPIRVEPARNITIDGWLRDDDSVRIELR